MTEQLGLPFVRGSATSKAAAKSMESAAESIRATVLAFIKAMGKHGATDEEIATAMPQWQQNTLRPRRRELVLKRLVVDSNQRRRTKSGRQATVWVHHAYV